MAKLSSEIRPNDDGTIDEVLLFVDGRCVFHLEQMDDDAYWFALYTYADPLDRDSFWMSRKKKRILLHHEESGPSEESRTVISGSFGRPLSESVPTG